MNKIGKKSFRATTQNQRKFLSIAHNTFVITRVVAKQLDATKFYRIKKFNKSIENLKKLVETLR
jgi:predicted nucleic-acid-binding Zn-ribbon protein